MPDKNIIERRSLSNQLYNEANCNTGWAKCDIKCHTWKLEDKCKYCVPSPPWFGGFGTYSKDGIVYRMEDNSIYKDRRNEDFSSN